MNYTNDDINSAIVDLESLQGFKNDLDGFCYIKTNDKLKILMSCESMQDMNAYFKTISSTRSAPLAQDEIDDLNNIWNSFENLNIDDIREQWINRGLVIEGNFDLEEYVIDQGLED